MNQTEIDQWIRNETNRYYENISLKNKAKNEGDAYIRERNRSRNNVNDLRNQKTNLEKRLAQVIDLISYLEHDVTNSIEYTGKSSLKAQQKYCEAIKCNGSNASIPRIQEIFKIKAIDEDCSALQECYDEKKRIESNICNINKNITTLENYIGQLNRNIVICQNNVDYYNSQARNNQYNIDYYRSL